MLHAGPGDRRGVPGASAQAVEDADTCFGIELPALTRWEFGVEHP
ncbi:hypothetical protein ACQEV2_18755 [Streptomyces sp. CA-251387]